eukprot:GFUD01031698.1.p1 GENE.GFUD01031698.1~~GFUD01031698.1.p1  ORF type:complete len:1104 (-),score=383.94 GFUD01031698.1:84-3395(-)
MKAPVEVQFAQKLAANEPPVRDKAVKKLKKWFGARAEVFDDVEMMKIWKGLYYCFWMSDKPLVQEELAENISSFVTCFQSSESSLVFIRSFFKTFGREWFGIDRWRSDKFMMFTRRFLRHIFKFVASKEWEKGLVEKVVDIFRNDLVLCPIADTFLAFQLHFTDVFLEELAKVGGEKLDPEVLEMFLDPYVEAVRVGQDARFRDHVVERIFNHLMRQSDPGIEWQMEEDGEGMEEEVEDDVEDEENSDGENSENGEVDEDMNGDSKQDEEDGEDDGEVVQDPRAGRVDAVIPQMNVGYLKLSEKLFELGSGDGVRKANRDALYKISKMFKDVASDVFPLGPNISELQNIDIPKISVKKSAADLLKRNEEILRKNLEEKIKNKKLMSKMSKKAKVEVTPQNGIDSDGSEDNKENENGEASADDSSDDELEPAEEKEKKMSSKDLRRKRKQEQKKRKREKAFKLEQEKSEKDKKAQEMVDQDIERKTALEPVKSITNGVLQDKENKIEEKVEKMKNLEKKKKKKSKILNGVDATNDTDTVQELIKIAEDLEEKSEMSAKKKKKKKDKKPACEEATICTDVDTSTVSQENIIEGSNNAATSPTTEPLSESVLSVSKKKKKKKDRVEVVADSAVCSPETSFYTPNTSIAAEPKTEDLTTSKKKKKKLKRTAAEAELGAESGKEEILSNNVEEEPFKKPDVITTSVVEEPFKKPDVITTSVVEEPFKKPDVITTSVKKMKKKKKEMYRIDSDIAFNTPSLSQVNLVEKSVNKTVEDKLAAVPEIGTPKEAIPAETESGTPMESTPAETEVVSTKKKKKKVEDKLAAVPEIGTPKEAIPAETESGTPMESTPAETEVVSSKKKKKMKKYNAETSLLLHNDESTPKPTIAPAFLPIVEEKKDTPKSEKKKKKKSNKLEFGSPGTQESGVAPKSAKVFEEDNTWDGPLKPGETEIVLPNKNYKGSLKLSEPAKAAETETTDTAALNGFVTPVKSYTSTFLKKALSKSVDPKKIKKDKKDKCLSEPRKKRVNIVLTQNKSQDIPQHLKSVKNSPQTPHDPAKNPVKSVLKKRVSLESGTRLNPVMLNTQLNGRSKAAKVLVGKKRRSAMDFF